MMETLIDQAKPLRNSDAFDVDAVMVWLKKVQPELSTDLQQTPEVRQFSGGASNLTYHLDCPEENGQKHDFILRRPPAGHKAASAHDMHREYRVMKALKPVYPWVPDTVAFCDDHEVLGSDFYLMERLQGIIPRANLPKGMKLTPEETRQLCFIDH